MKQATIFAAISALVFWVGCGGSKEIKSLKDENKRLRVELQNLKKTTALEQTDIALQLPSLKNAVKIHGDGRNPLVITIPRDSNHILLNGEMINIEKLEPELKKHLIDEPNLTLTIEADGKADFEIVVRVRDIAKSVGIKKLNAFVQEK